MKKTLLLIAPLFFAFSAFAGVGYNPFTNKLDLTGSGGSVSVGGTVTGSTPCGVFFGGTGTTLGQDATHLCYDYTNYNLHIGTIPADMSGFGPGLTIKQGYSILFPSNDFVLGASGDLGAITHSGSAFNIDTYETGATTGGTINVGRAAAGGTLNLGALAEAAVNIYGVIANVNSTTAYFAGNVGIGTSSPSFKFQVSSGAIFNDGSGAGIYTTGNSTATAFIGSGASLTALTAANISAGSLGPSVRASSITLAAMYGAPTLTGTNFTSLPGAQVGSGVPAANIASGPLGSSVIVSSVALNAIGDQQMASTSDAMKRQITIVIDGGGSALTTGAKKVYIRVPYDMTLTGVDLVADQSGSVVLDVWKDTYANFPPTVADTITASAKPTLSSAVKSQDTTLTGWTTTLTAGDYIEVNVDSITTVTKVILSLYGTIR